MVVPSFRARSLFAAALLLSVPSLSLISACNSQPSTAPPGTGTPIFGDAGNPPVKDATTPKDTGHDALKDGRDVDGAKDGAKDGSKDGVSDGLAVEGGDLGTGTPCTRAIECSSRVCDPASLVGKVDGEIFFDAGRCTSEDALGTCVCQSPSCHDGVKNGKETDVDCGGGICDPCPNNSKCDQGARDCLQGECGVGYEGRACTGLSPEAGPGDADRSKCICESPTCTDGVQNEDETDVDCGGSICGQCSLGKTCKLPGDCSSSVCTLGLCACPAGMTVSPVANSVPYCIDTYEVTYELYSGFVGAATAATIAAQASECLWNTTFVPSNNWPQVGVEAQNPVAFVNWCDAFAYCKSVGHHLCGAIANSLSPGSLAGTPVPLAKVDDAGVLEANDRQIDEWYNACSSQGQNAYPYGNTYEQGWCNGVDSPAQATTGGVDVPPGVVGSNIMTPAKSCVLDTCAPTTQAGVLSTVSKGENVSCEVVAAYVPPAAPPAPACALAFGEASCVGGSSTNINWDMSGNVAEWENSCSANVGVSDSCAVRGGAYDTKPGTTTLLCASSAVQPPMPRSTQAADIGFRCCL